MGARGPAPTPTRILKAQGSKLVRDRDGEMTLPVEAPACPGWLGKEAKAEWRRIIGDLQGAGVIAKVDRALLTAYCEAWGEFVEVAAECAKATKDGSYVVAIERGLVNAKNRAVERLLRVAQQFGLSPSARTRVKSCEGAPADSAKSRFFRAG